MGNRKRIIAQKHIDQKRNQEEYKTLAEYVKIQRQKRLMQELGLQPTQSIGYSVISEKIPEEQPIQQNLFDHQETA